ncbi:MAG: DNA-binding protein [Rhodococcus sp.]|uniref:Zn-ribbon domain-containing OB-fold protein n=1 Tax=Rhodococcus TaxID=1827 RepID=UPI0016A3B964|nr:OB-fold nucleic acid binding domain-containing protein [Rhodococcus sp. (in: high G+C Gram-positive bacteria)]NLV78482.1 DNA-binding protein [Rhodococcus sp. (in: high G+C Gram-positive bacteria)]
MSLGKSAVAEPPLSAPLNLKFDYTRSTGPTVGAFVTGLRDGRIVGARGSDGRILVPPPEFDPVTHDAPTDFVDVGQSGTVVSWTWNAQPLPGQPFDRPFAWALIRLDGADTALLHVVDVPSADDIRTGMRVRARWADERVGDIHDIVAFEPGEAAGTPDAPAPGEPVTMLTTPIDLLYKHTASPEESWYLRGLKEGRIVGGRTGPGGKVYVPPRGASPTDGVPTKEHVEVSDRGIVTTFCIVNVPFMGQQIKPPYVAAYVLLDGADIPFLHLILECDASEVRMGMRVQAKWRPQEEWDHTLRNIEYFRPTGEPDADFDSFKHHL